ncbi:unnamed protein product [Mytilus edulis]|uniref:B box-type domain-containing protein n=1 Tax=Mytilus edulis TaxID=6550 RepID=A0A8S3RHJ0_MYTED|nr:unnamed protein product [Mytilus edulis]
MEYHGLSKGTRKHKIIPISQYHSLSNFVRDLQQRCIHHNEKYKQYCIKHECLICYKCIIEHGKCNAVVPLEDVVSGVKTSKLLEDVEASLKDTLENIKRIREDREMNITSIQNEAIKITFEIDSIKQQINQHLDTLKNDFLKELARIVKYQNGVIQTVVSSLKDQEKAMTQFCMEIQNIKRHASDLQTFISMRVLQSKVTENDRRLESMIKNESLENVTIQLTIDDKIKNILTFVNTFGRILIKKSSPDKTHMQSHKNKQALASMPNTIQSINNFSIALELKIDTSSKWSRGCTMTQKRGFIFTDYFNANEKLVKLDAQCNTEYIIQLSSPYSAFDVELIDENTVAVTTGKSVGFGKRRGISIVDLTKRNVIKFIDLPNHTYGITFDGISLICCVEDRDLHMISSIDYSITTVPNTVLPWFSYVSTYACKIFFAVYTMGPRYGSLRMKIFLKRHVELR